MSIDFPACRVSVPSVPRMPTCAGGAGCKSSLHYTEQGPLSRKSRSLMPPASGCRAGLVAGLRAASTRPKAPLTFIGHPEPAGEGSRRSFSSRPPCPRSTTPRVSLSSGVEPSQAASPPGNEAGPGCPGPGLSACSRERSRGLPRQTHRQIERRLALIGALRQVLRLDGHLVRRRNGIRGQAYG